MKDDDLHRKMAEIKTGRVSGDLYHIGRQYYVDDYGRTGEFRTFQQKEAYKKREHIRKNNESRSRKHYVNCYHEPIKEITQKLSLSELGAVIKLLPYLRFKKDGLLTKDGKPMNLKTIGEVIGKKERQTSKVIRSLIESGIIVKEGERKGAKYFVSGQYHTIGYTNEGQAFTKLYQKETRLKADKLTTNDVGLLYKALPYFHYQSYFLCANPDAEEKKEDLEHLNVQQLADLIGESRDTVRRSVDKLVNNGFMMRITSCNNSKIKVNPDIMFREEYESEYTDTVRRDFYEMMRGFYEE